MGIRLWQVILLSLLAFIAIEDDYNLKIGIHKPVVIGFISGLIMGDIKTGLLIGGTIELMFLGGGGYGGSPVPDYATATIITTALGVSTGEGLELALVFALPVGLLLMQFTTLCRFLNVYFVRRAEVAIKEHKFDKLALYHRLGMGILGGFCALSVAICLVLGDGFINRLLEVIPQPLMDGLAVAGGLLPAMGIAILLKYLPIKNYIAYGIIGFIIIGYLKLPMMAVAGIGAALAIIKYNELSQSSAEPVNSNSAIGGNEDE